MNASHTEPFVALAVVHLLTYLAVVWRHAIPRSPVAFHVALTLPMLIGVVLLFLLAVAAEVGGGSLLGVDDGRYLQAFLWTDVVWLSILLYYAFWWYRYGRNEEA